MASDHGTISSDKVNKHHNSERAGFVEDPAKDNKNTYFHYLPFTRSLILLRNAHVCLFNFCPTDCGTSFTNSSGYIFSPHFPSYYPPSKRCKWKISVPSGNIIKLKFIEFQLEEHPSCSNDYIEVFDGQVETAQRLGRFCGERFPIFLRSSSNVVEIIFSSNNNITRSGFKLLYTSEKSE